MAPTQANFRFTKDGMSRRQFLSSTAACAAVSGTSSLILPIDARAATAKRGGTLRLGIGGGSTTDSLDPALLIDIMGPVVSLQLRNCLVEVDADNNVQPELAESWERSSDAKVWRFKLRQGVAFHNGKDLTADDVVYSYNHHRNEKSKSAIVGLVAQIEDIRSDGADTVVITLDSANADFLYITSAYHLQVVPEGSIDFSDGMGTGPYILESWEPGVRAFAKRNPNYFKEGRPYFDDVETLGINDVFARHSALLNGSVDVINRVDPKTAGRLEQTPGFQLVIQHGTKHYTMPMRTDVAPFDDNDIRLALKHAVDREAFVGKILHGQGIVGNDHPISPLNRYFAKELPQRTYDPDKARFHLKKAGAENLSIKLHVADVVFEGAVDAGVLFKEAAAKAGIEVDLVREPNDGYWSNVWMKKSFCLSHWSGRLTEDWMFSEAYAEGSNWNETFWKHEKFNALLRAARGELDEDKRRQMYFDMQTICRDEGGAIIPMFANDVHAATTKMAHNKLSGNWELDNYRISERWWFA